MVLATLCFAIADALAKLLTEQYPFMQVIWLRGFFGLLLIGGVILGSGNLQHFATRRPGWHLSRTLVGIVLTAGIFTGLKYLPLAEVTALVFANPLIIALWSSLVLKEPVRRSTFVAILLGLAGVILVVRPTPDHFHFAHLFMLGFAAATAFLIITARRLSDTESVLALNFYLYPGILVFASFWAFRNWVAPDLLDWLIFFGISFFATVALFSVTKAMRYALPTRVAPFDYTRIIWTVLIGYIFWGEMPDAITWMGILIIVSCGLYIVTRDRMAVVGR